LEFIDYSAFTNSTFVGTLDVSHVKYIQGYIFTMSSFDKVIRGDVVMDDGPTPYNTYGIYSKSIKLSDGSWYNGTNA